MSVSEMQSVPSTDDYGKMTPQELMTRLDEDHKTLQDTLAICARNINVALRKGDRVSFVGDITDALHAGEATWRLARYLEGSNQNYRIAPTPIMLDTGHALNRVRNRLGSTKLGASTLATCCFHLYYDVEVIAKHPDLHSLPEVNVPNILLFLETVFQSLLNSQNIVIVLFQKHPDAVWFSSDSKLSSRLHRIPLPKYLDLQQMSRESDSRSSTDIDPTSAKVHLEALSEDHLQRRAGKVQNNLIDILNPQQIKSIIADYYVLTDFYVQAQLQKIATRKDPQIQMGPVDLCCAFVVCNPSMSDCPVIYASPAFEALTGYAKHEVLSRNCRFLQSPDGQMHIANKPSLLELKHKIAQGREYQLTLINYKKGGQPFANLLTVVPILDGRIFFYIGFLIDIAERPGCIFGKNANGTYRVNYSRNQVPEPVNAATAPTDSPAPVLQSNDPVEPTELLSTTTPEADSPWTVTDVPAPPYALSPGVFYHTSRMGMLSP